MLAGDDGVRQPPSRSMQPPPPAEDCELTLRDSRVTDSRPQLFFSFFFVIHTLESVIS